MSVSSVDEIFRKSNWQLSV